MQIVGKTTLKTESLTILLYSPYCLKWGAPHLRHSRSMHLYQSGIPLSYIKDFLGHVSVSTTDIYACADTTMIRDALKKATNMDSSQPVKMSIWKGDEDMILKLCGLK